MSHLRPIDRATGRAKALAQYSAEELAHAITQTVEDVKLRRSAQLPADRSALDQFAAEAARRQDVVQQQRLADALNVWFPKARA